MTTGSHAEHRRTPQRLRAKAIFELFTGEFRSWLSAGKASIAFTTYQVGKIFFSV
jgi:hypothetical protein